MIDCQFPVPRPFSFHLIYVFNINIEIHDSRLHIIIFNFKIIFSQHFYNNQELRWYKNYYSKHTENVYLQSWILRWIYEKKIKISIR